MVPFENSSRRHEVAVDPLLLLDQERDVGLRLAGRKAGPHPPPVDAGDRRGGDEQHEQPGEAARREEPVDEEEHRRRDHDGERKPRRGG